MSNELQPSLFEDDPSVAQLPPPVATPVAAGVARVSMPNRTQLELRPCDLEALLPEGHRARLVWAWVERAALLAVGAVTLKRVAQDGIRIRASAGAASFRRGETLAQCLERARAQVEALKRQREDDPGVATPRQQAARERQERIERALKRLPQMAETARVSTTDAEATVMKMADGGYRPAYNGQFVSDTTAQVIVGVEAVTAGTDMAQLTPMIEQVNDRDGQHPAEWLVDGGYPAHEQLEQAAASTVVYAPVPKPKDAAKDIYKERASTAECVNAQARERGLTCLRVRGTPKARCVPLLHALAHNPMRTFALAPDLLGYGRGASAESAMQI